MCGGVFSLVDGHILQVQTGFCLILFVLAVSIFQETDPPA